MLTAWMRFKYPNLVDGGLAASAPIIYTEGIVPKTAFFKKVTDVSQIYTTYMCVYGQGSSLVMIIFSSCLITGFYFRGGGGGQKKPPYEFVRPPP